MDRPAGLGYGLGPGGVGGLMEVRHHNPGTNAVTARYQPIYDHNANVIAYVDATTHAMVASFDHTPFGRLRFPGGDGTGTANLEIPGFTSEDLGLVEIYEQAPKPLLVVAIGACGCTGGIFAEGDTFAGPVDKIIPVDAYIPGCPPKPEAILAGIVKLLGKN